MLSEDLVHPGAVDKSSWDHGMYDAAKSLFEYWANDLEIDEDEQVMSEAADLLVEANVRKSWQIKHAPQDKIDAIFQGEGLDQHRTLIGYARARASEAATSKPQTVQTDANTMMAKAVSRLAQE